MAHVGHTQLLAAKNLKMKNKSILLLLVITILSTNQLFSQSKDKTIQVTGHARIVVRPDIGILNIGVSEIKPTMKNSVDALAELTNGYTEKLEELGFKKEDIKTTSFSVSKNRVYRNNDYIDSGYVASQNVRLEFEYKEDILGKILDQFSESDLELNFSFSFKLSEELKQKVQQEIIADAVKDGQAKAKTIATASNQTILELKSISYGSWGGNSGMERVTREREYYASAAASGRNSKSFNFRPDDIIFKDSVTMYFKIK